MISKFKSFIIKLFPFIINKLSCILFGSIGVVKLSDIKCEENSVFVSEDFNLPDLKDSFGFINKDFNGYSFTIPPLKVRLFNNFYCFTNKEEIYNEKKEVVEEYTSQKRNPMYRKSKYIFYKKNTVYLNATVAHLSLSGLENNYYHFLTECLSRYFIVNNSIYKPDYFIISNHISFQKQLLILLGVKDECIISADSNLLINATRLVVPDFINNWKIVTRKGYNTYQKIWAPSWLPSQFKESFKMHILPQNNKSYIYISRQKAAYRKFVNHIEAEELLNNFGFKKYILEDLTIIQQINIFSSAKIIFGIHGAGFANLYFAHTGTFFFELFSPNYTDSSFKILAKTNQLNYNYLLSDFDNFKNIPPKEEDVFIDIPKLKRALNTLINETKINEL
jgi:hypothetical protein